MELEAAVHREWFAPSYETTEELLQISVDRNNASLVPSLPPWIPHTTAAAALRLMKMDAAIFYSQEHRQSNLRTIDIQEPSRMVYAFPSQYLELVKKSKHASKHLNYLLMNGSGHFCLFTP